METRSYSLPKGKLKALTALMVRPDVPVLVSPGKKAIEVQGTPDQHEIFGAFVQLIHPDGDDVSSAAEAADRIRALALAINDGALVEGKVRAKLLATHAEHKRAEIQALEIERRALEGEREQLHNQLEIERREIREAIERERREMEHEREAVHRDLEHERNSLREALQREREGLERERDDLGRSLDDERRAMQEELRAMRRALDDERTALERERLAVHQQSR